MLVAKSKNHSSKAIFISSTDANASIELVSLEDFPKLWYQGLIKAFWLLLPKQTFLGTWAFLQLGDRIGIRLLVGLLLPFKSSVTTRDDDEASKEEPELLFIDTVDRLLVGEAVKDLSHPWWHQFVLSLKKFKKGYDISLLSLGLLSLHLSSWI